MTMAILIYAQKGASVTMERTMTAREAYQASERARTNPEYFALYWTEGSNRSIDSVRAAVLRLANQQTTAMPPKAVTPKVKVVIGWTAKKAEHRLEVWPEDVETTIATLKASGHAAKVIE